jgi:ATP-dependent RNA helicase DeaD
VMDDGQLAFYKEVADELLDEYDAEILLAAALKMLSGETKAPTAPSVDFGDTGAEAGMVRLFLNVGRQQLIQPADVVRSIASQTGIPGNVIGLINIYDRFTFVEVPKDVAAQVVQAMQDATIKGRSVNIEPAKRR